MAARVSGSSYTQAQGLHAAPPVPPADSETYADRTYDDGYVKLDPGTANPEAVGGPGLTWNWAYDRAEQYDAPAGLLSFRRSYERAAVPALDGAAGGHGDLDGFGVTVQAGRTLHRSGRWSFDLGVAFQGVWGLDATLSSTAYAEDIGRLDLTDRFDVAGAVHPDHGFAPRAPPRRLHRHLRRTRRCAVGVDRRLPGHPQRPGRAPRPTRRLRPRHQPGRLPL
ncbi:MAG: hypothetical protein M5U12_21955 [Verrucomicrobia bacterium]|nr:hypothetical protein [Verrucomicrobiota bacterium]